MTHMNLFNAHPTPESARAQFWLWRVTTKAYWRDLEVEEGYAMIEGWK